MQQLDGAQRRHRGWDGAELEGVEEHRAEPMQHRPGAQGQGREVHLVRAGQAFGLGNARRKLFPADGGHHGAVQVSTSLLGRDQRGAELGEQAHLVVGGTRVAQEGDFFACLGAAEHAAHRAVEQADPVVGQACRGVQHGRDQGCPATEQRERPQVLGGEAPALAGQLAQPLRMHALGRDRIEADGAQAGELLDHALEGFVARCAGRLPRPGQHAQGRALLDSEQRVESLGLYVGQAAGELSRDVAFGHDQDRGNQALDHARAGGDDSAPAQFVHERRGDGEGIRGGQRHRQQPSQHLAAVPGCIHAKAKRLAQSTELLVAGLEPGGVGRERVGISAKLFGNKTERLCWDQLPGPQQAAGVA